MADFAHRAFWIQKSLFLSALYLFRHANPACHQAFFGFETMKAV